MVATVSRYGQPALGLTDHGNMAGSAQLYKECRKAEILPFPGSELYVVHSREDKKAKRHHMCVVAYSTKGYENLCRLSTMTNENFYNKPLIDHRDFAMLSEQGLLEGIAATSGCYFGFAAQAVSNGDLDHARQVLQTYQGWFNGNYYVELQNHGIDHGNGMDDDALADIMLGLATELGLPCVLTQDSHYCDQHDKPVHETLKRLIAYGDDVEDAVFPGDGFHLADTGWFLEHHSDERLVAGTEGLVDLMSKNDLQIKQLDNYQYNIPFTVEKPLDVIRKRCQDELIARNLAKTEYASRLHEELHVIEVTGMAGYLALVSEITDWCKDNEVYTLTRGSASGSLTCWLLGITQVNPIKYGLSFERFISVDRTKPPDIDLDVEHEERERLLEWLSERFSVTQIGRWIKHGLSGDGETGKGSLRVKYFAQKRRQGQPIEDWNKVPYEDKKELFALADSNAYSGHGTHPAGVCVTSTDEEFDMLVPKMWVASSKNMVSQYAMDDIEDLGIVKMDILGSKTLSIIKRTMKLLGRDYHDGLDWIPLSDPKVFAAISKGQTEGVFQLEGWTAKNGVKRLKPTKLRDVVDSMALFRPATMNSGATDLYIARRQKQAKIPQRHPYLMEVVADTQGIFLFQEQVIEVLREIGLDANELTKFLKAVKASNANIGSAGEVIKGYRNRVERLCDEYGISGDDFEWLWESATGFAAYGFNKAHSQSYGLIAYYCAYLSVHHPVEFHTALLDVHSTESDKIDGYVAATRGRGIRIRQPSVNESNESYTMAKSGKYIRRGLTAVDGIGTASAKKIVRARPENGFTSLMEFAKLTKVSGTKPFIEEGVTDVGIFGKLLDSGAFEGIIDD